MQETTRRRNDNRHIHSDPSRSNTCETSGTSSKIWTALEEGNLSNSRGSGQHKRVRFSDQEHLGTKTSRQEAPMTRKKSSEIDAERVEEGAAETAETDFDKRAALKRKAEGDPGDSLTLNND